jgi:hypothetical protein
MCAGPGMDRLFHLRLCRSLQLFQAADQNRIFAHALVAFRLDGLENGAQPIQQLQ